MALNQKDAKSKSCSNEYLTYNNNFAVNLVWFGRAWFGKKPNLVEIRPKIKNIQIIWFDWYKSLISEFCQTKPCKIVGKIIVGS